MPGSTPGLFPGISSRSPWQDYDLHSWLVWSTWSMTPQQGGEGGGEKSSKS